MVKIRSFTDLNAWKEAHKLVLLGYKILKQFPRSELYSLTSQVRRSLISVTSNIAEGFSRSTKKEKTYFYHVALGSITEIQNQFILARDLGYIETYKFENIASQVIIVQKLINGLIKTARSKNT